MSQEAFPLPKRNVGQVGIDLDNTLAEPRWPDPAIGDPIPLGVRALKFYFSQGFGIILSTSRPASHVPAIWEWLERHGLRPYVYDVKPDKLLVDALIDDRAYRFPDAFEAQR